MRSFSWQCVRAQDKMGGAKQQYQEMIEFVAEMTESSEELTRKTLELLERNLEVVELKNHIRNLTKAALGMSRFDSFAF